jgi:hypothetical protein
MSVKKLSKLAGAQATTGPVGVVGNPALLDYQIEDALRTICKAEQHRKDKPLMREVKKLAKAHAKACGMK